MPSATETLAIGSGSPTQAIIAAIADREGVDITEIEPPAYEPLYTVINPEALETLFTAGSPADARVVFEYEGYELAVYSSGQIDIADTDR